MAASKHLHNKSPLYRCLEAKEPQSQAELHDLVVLAVQGGNLPGIVTRGPAG